MLTVRLLVLVVLLGITLEINAEKVDLNAIFETPQKNYDDLEILERSTFESDDPKPPAQPSNCIKDEPKAVANAQVLLTFPIERTWNKLNHNHLPIIESRNFVGHDMLCPQPPLTNGYPFPFHPSIYPPHPNDPYFFPKDNFYPHLPPYGYNPPQFHRIPPCLPPCNSIPKETECPQITTTPTPICTSSTVPPCRPKEVYCIYDDLLAIIEKMVHYLLRDSPHCNIKFSDHEKLKIAEALNIIIKYLNMKCRNVSIDLQYCRNQELNVEVSLILEDILSMLPITMLQARCGKLELNNQLNCLLSIVKHIRETYGHIRGLCSIYKNLKDMFKPCIFVKDCKSNNYLSKENIRGYLLMDSLNLALYLIYKNNINENLAQKKHEMVDLWVDYLYKTQFLNCNEVCPAKVPLLDDVKSTEELLTKLRKLFLYEYVLRLREKDPNIQGVDSIISFCTKNCTCTFGIQHGSKITDLKGELDKNKITLEELLSLVENHLKSKYNFKPTTECTPCCIESSIPLQLTVNEEPHIHCQPCESKKLCPKPPICPESPVKPPICPKPNRPVCQTSQTNLGPEAPLCPKPPTSPPNLGGEAPICSKPNLGPQPPICPKPSTLSPNPQAPICCKPVYSQPNLGDEGPICSKPPQSCPDTPICRQPPSRLPNPGLEPPICVKPHRSRPPICQDLPIPSHLNLSNCLPQNSELNLGPEAPICPKPPYNLGANVPICSEPPIRPHYRPPTAQINLGQEAPICPINVGSIRDPCRRPVAAESFEDFEVDFGRSNNFGPVVFPTSYNDPNQDFLCNCQHTEPIFRNNCISNLRPRRPSLCQLRDPVLPTPNTIQASLAPPDLGCVIEDPVDLGHKLCNLNNAGIDYPKPLPIDCSKCPNPVPHPSIDVASVYCDERPMSKLHSDHLGCGYKILTSSEPIRCLGCGGGGGCRKFPLDMDAFNAYQTYLPENDIGFAQIKDVGCRKPVPNGRRCPYCTPYLRELDF